LTAGLYKELDVGNTHSSTLYDLFDRSFEFVVTGNPPLHTEAFRHPGSWSTRVRPAGEELRREVSGR
jgi:hypothetical protein